MKIKLKNTQRANIKLTIESGAEEKFCYSVAEQVKLGCDETLLTFSYEKSKKGYCIFYYLGTARPLAEYLKKPLLQDHFESMLLSFLRLGQTCTSHQDLSMQRISFNPDYIFFDPMHLTLKFVYIPIADSGQNPSNPLDALAYILDNAQLSPAAKAKADKMLDFVHCSTIFSPIEYEAKLKELGYLASRQDESAWLPPVPSDTEPLSHKDGYGFDFFDSPDNPPKQSLTSSLDYPAEEPSPCRQESDSALGFAKQRTKGASGYALVRVLDNTTWDLPEGRTLLGTSAQCNIVLTDVLGLSRKHVLFVVQTGHCYIQDMNSTNGTFVSGQRLPADKMFSVGPGTSIQLAKTIFKLVKK